MVYQGMVACEVAVLKFLVGVPWIVISSDKIVFIRSGKQVIAAGQDK